VSRRLDAYLRTCLRNNRRAWVKVRITDIANTFGVSVRTLKRALAKLRASTDQLRFRTVTQAGGGRGWSVLVSDRAGVEPFMEHHARDRCRGRVVRTWLRGSRVPTTPARRGSRLSDKSGSPYTGETFPSGTPVSKPRSSWPSGRNLTKVNPPAAESEAYSGNYWHGGVGSRTPVPIKPCTGKHRGLARYCHWFARDLWDECSYDNAKILESHAHIFSMVYRLKLQRISDEKIRRAFKWAFIETHKLATDYALINDLGTGFKFCLSHTVALAERKFESLA
jgi:hypothetical protein